MKIVAVVALSILTFANSASAESCHDRYMAASKYCGAKGGSANRCFGDIQTKYDSCKRDGTWTTGDGVTHSNLTRE